MNVNELKNISELSEDQQLKALKAFESNNTNSRAFSLNRDERKIVWANLFRIISDSSSSKEVVLSSLVACRILSRDTQDLNESVENKDVDVLVHVVTDQSDKYHVTVRFEAKKVLSNLVQQSTTVLAYCLQSNLIIKLLSSIQNHQKFDEVERFDVRVMIILTIKCEEARDVVKSSLNGVEKLIEVLERLVQIYKSSSLIVISDHDKYIGELVKLLFNLTRSVEPEDTAELTRLCSLLDNVINLKYESCEAADEVLKRVIHLLTNVHDIKEATDVLFLHDDMKNIDKILQFLLTRLETLQGQQSFALKEEVPPVLMVLWGLSKIQPPIRKYLKKKILPPLTAQDLQKKPEEGCNARGRLVSLLTSADTDIATMAAELLFVLCKHNVGKLVKQTGYGNAAGLLARRGLMCGGQTEAIFSSDSEGEEADEREDYTRLAHKVNPITGRVEKEKKSPFEGMSEEQKEYEAVKIVNMMNQLMSSGVIKPATVGEDGKPRELEHVLQLQEGINLPTNQENDSDSD